MALTVKQLMNKLSKMPEDAKIVMCNHDVYNDGMYYVDNAQYDDTMDEPQVEIMSEYKRIAKGWED